MRLLVADDDYAICALLGMQLKRAGYDVVEVHDEAGVLHALVMDPTIQLLIVDWDMGDGSDGIKLVHKIDGLGRNVYIIILTSHSETKTIASTLDAGAHDYINKPWNKDILLARVRVGERSIKLQSELFLRSKALESAANAIVITDHDGTIQWVNPAFTSLTGYDEKETIGNNPRVQRSGKQDDDFYHEMWQTVTAGRVWQGVLTNRRKDGTEYIENMMITPVRNQGKISHFIAIKQDVTDYHNAVCELQEREKRMATILSNVIEGIIACDEHGTIQVFNQSAERLFGYTAAEAIGQNVRIIVPDSIRPRHQQLIDDYIQRETSDIIGREIEVDAPRKDGTTFPVSLSINDARDEDKHYFVAVVRDLTEQRSLQAQLNQAQKLEAIGQLAAGIAHEINTPTQYVGDNTRFMRDGIDDIIRLMQSYEKLREQTRSQSCCPDIIEEIDRVKNDIDLDFLIEELPAAVLQSLEGVDRVAEIVRAMKDFSYPGGEDKTLTDINQAIRSTITVCRNRWKYVADLETDFDDALPTVPCLIGEFNQVILNIIVNAADAIAEQFNDSTEHKGKITISTKTTDDMVVINITDNGPGIPDKIHDRIFEPFFTTKEVGKGTGQGLAICHDVIVNKHGGKINFQSAVNGGTIFTIQLPISETARDGKNRRAA